MLFSIDMKLKDLFKKKNVVNLEDSTNLKEKELIRKISRVGHLRLKLTAKSKFKLLDNLSFVPPTTTFELVDYPGHVMRARGLELVGERKRDDQGFAESSAFLKMPNLWFDGYVSYESSQTAGHYIRLRGNELILGRYDGSKIFKEECSFKMTREGDSCNECSFKNEWVEDEEGIGLLVNDNEEAGQEKKKDPKLLWVPETPPSIRKLPGLVSVDGPSRKKTVYRKDSEEFRRKKLVTFNKRNIIHEHEPVAWQYRHSNESFQSLPLNSVREMNESEDETSNTSLSEETNLDILNSTAVEQLNKSNTVNVRGIVGTSREIRRNDMVMMKETSFYDIRDNFAEKEESFDTPSQVNEDLNKVYTQEDPNNACNFQENSGDADDDNSEASVSSYNTSTKESCSSSGRICSCKENCLIFSDNRISKMNWDMENNLRERQEENLVSDNRYKLATGCSCSDESDHCYSNYDTDGENEIRTEFSTRKERKIGYDFSSSSNMDHQIRNELLQDHPIEEENKQNVTHHSPIENLMDKQPRVHHDTEERQEEILPSSNTIVTIDNADEPEGDHENVVLVCLPDEPSTNKPSFMQLSNINWLNSERDRSDSGLPLSPCGGDLIVKKMSRNKFFPS